MPRRTPSQLSDDQVAILQERRQRIDDVLTAALTRQGYVRHEPNTYPRCDWVIEGEPMRLQVTSHAPQPSAIAAWKKDCARSKEPSPFPLGPLQIVATLPGRTRRWSERAAPLEAQMERIVHRLQEIAAKAAEERRERERWFAAYARAEDRLAYRLYREEAARDCWKDVRKLAAQWEEAQRIRRFLDAAESSGRVSPDLLPQLAWARQRVERFDPLAGENSRLADVLAQLELDEPVYELTDEDRHFDRAVAEAQRDLPTLCQVKPRKP